ncbi:MAG: PAS domain S-box protein [Lentisphaerae bacterium]|nr:PAS domain S-box protein [Lentisphaerota bacterium]
MTESQHTTQDGAPAGPAPAESVDGLKLTLKQLRESEGKYRAMLESMGGMIYIASPDHRIEYMNAAMKRWLGRDATGESCAEALYGLTPPCSWCPQSKLKPGETVYTETVDPRTGRVIALASTPIAREDGTVSIMSVITDITERKATGKALHESEARYRKLVESVTDYIYTVTVENGRAVSTTHGDACVAVTGYASAEYTANPNLWYQMIHMEDRPMVLELVQQLLAGKPVQALEHRLIHKNGSIIWVKNTFVPHVDEQGRLASYDGLLLNITERKMAEEAIKEHARKLEIINRLIISVNKATDWKTLFHVALVASMELTGFDAGDVYLLNDETGTAELQEALGLTAELQEKFKSVSIQHPFHKKLLFEAKSVFSSDADDLDIPFLVRWGVRSVAAVPFFSQNKVAGALQLYGRKPHVFPEQERDLLESIGRQIGTVITKLRSETALRESEEKYRTITEQQMMGIYMFKDGRVLFANEGLARILGYPRELIMAWDQNALLGVVHPDDRAFFLDQLQRKQRRAQDVLPQYDCRLKARDNEIKWVMIHSRSIPYAGGNAVIAVVMDITDRKLAEQSLGTANRQLKAREEQLRNTNEELFATVEQLKSSQKDLMSANLEKEFLMKEIHHRVKNNLQVISSLLKLQSGYIKDQKAVDLLKECQNRIKSMAIVHEKIYQSKRLAEVDIGEYIRSLMDHLFHVYLVSPEAVKPEIAVEKVSLGLDQAIPCSIIINELVSNALKYAFPEGRKGVIRVALAAVNDRHFVLEIGDSGVGLPKHVDFRNTTSMGMQLVIMFVDQLDGTIELGNDHGTTFTIRFPLENASLHKRQSAAAT